MKYLLFLLLLAALDLNAQDCPQVWLSGKVLDTLRPQSFYNLMVVNRTTGKGVFGQPDGSFGVYVRPGDSITLSVKNYYMMGFRVSADSNCRFGGDFIISHKATDLDEFVVRPLKTLQQVKEERASLALRETRTIEGLEAFQSPITFLYERFSKSERARAEIARMKYQDSQVQVVQELLRLYVAYDVIDLSEEEFLEFIGFLALDENFLKTASDMELITFIKDKYEHFRRIKGN
jgi:hypothetical protein